MSDDKRKNRPSSYEEAPPTRWVPIKRADPVPPPPEPAPELPAAPRAAPPPVDPRTPFAAHRESQSGMMRLARHQGESRVVAVAVVAGAALLALAFAALQQ